MTVETKQGKCLYGDYEITFVDLPGTYSLTAFSDEELIARNYILEEQPDVVIDIVDALLCLPLVTPQLQVTH